MKDKILKWWNRTWSDWSYQYTIKVYGSNHDKYPIYDEKIYKRTSNDGLEEFKKVKI